MTNKESLFKFFASWGETEARLGHFNASRVKCQDSFRSVVGSGVSASCLVPTKSYLHFIFPRVTIAVAAIAIVIDLERSVVVTAGSGSRHLEGNFRFRDSERDG